MIKLKLANLGCISLFQINVGYRASSILQNFRHTTTPITVVVKVSGDEGGAEIVFDHLSPSYPVDSDNVSQMNAAEIGRSSGPLLFDCTMFFCYSK
ncbi:hypothetical protein MKMG_00140 [Methanogenium sp. MK-MG]|nr:hypothetical protein MKMG_00140 [Methanogenium sp. MK-MG]